MVREKAFRWEGERRSSRWPWIETLRDQEASFGPIAYAKIRPRSLRGQADAQMPAETSRMAVVRLMQMNERKSCSEVVLGEAGNLRGTVAVTADPDPEEAG